MSVTDSAPDDFREATPGTMDIDDVRAASAYDGWVVIARKCRPRWRDRLAEQGYQLGTISADGDGHVRVHIRPPEGQA
jgi:hypothetical protein